MGSRTNRSYCSKVPQQPLAQVPVDAVWDWQTQANCIERDVSMFFHPTNERGRTRRRREITAKSICFNCTVRVECADYAIRAREPYGVWGGLTEAEREDIYDTIPLDEYPRSKGEGARKARLAIDRAIEPNAFSA